MISFNVDCLELGPLWANGVVFLVLGAFSDLFDQTEIWLFTNEFKSFQCGLGSDDVFFIVTYLVLDIEDKLFHFLTSFLSLFQNMFLSLIPYLVLIVAINQIYINRNKHIYRISHIDKLNQLDNLFQNNFPQLLDRLHLREFILQFTLVK